MMHKPTAIVVNLDGTLAVRSGRTPRHRMDMRKVGSDEVNIPALTVLYALQRQLPRATTIIVSGREDYSFEVDSRLTTTWAETQRWLGRNMIRFSELYLRAEGDYRPTFAVKKEIYQYRIEPRYKVDYVLDASHSALIMWRQLGLTTLWMNGPNG